MMTSILDVEKPNPDGLFPARINDYERRIGDLERLLSGSGQQQERRNLLDNGSMMIMQRTSPVTAIAGVSGVRVIDRWFTEAGNLGQHTQSQETSGPANTPFKNSLKILFTTADASPAAGDYLIIHQALEGRNLQHLLWGTSAAKPLTLSFWVRANLTGTFVVELYRDETTDRHISTNYTVIATNTWELKTITVPGDQTTAITNDNANRLSLNFWCGGGTTFSSGTLQTSWGNKTDANRIAGSTNVAGTVNNFIEWTGVQLEPGSSPTPYEIRRYLDEFESCQECFQRWNFPPLRGVMGELANGSVSRLAMPLPVTMRATPTTSLPLGAGLNIWDGLNAGTTSATIGSNNSPNGSVVDLDFGSSTMAAVGTAGGPGSATNDQRVRSVIVYGGTLDLSAEI